jgi:hypothetical protein
VAFRIDSELGENAINFENAWDLSVERRKKRCLPRSDVSAKRFDYQAIGMLGSQVQRMMSIVDFNNVTFVLYDDFKSDPSFQYARVIKFLGLYNDERQQFPVINANRVKKSELFDYAIRVMSKVKSMTGINPNLGLLSTLKNFNTKYSERQPLTEQMTMDLCSFYKSDVILLEEIIGRDLSHWIESC